MNLFEHWDAERMLSTMQRLRDENARMRRQRTIDRIVFWACFLAVVTVSILTHRGGVI